MLRCLYVALGISADEAFGLEPSNAPAAAIEPAQPQSTLIRRLLRRKCSPDPVPAWN
jgi:hypothetical protein